MTVCIQKKGWSSRYSVSCEVPQILSAIQVLYGNAVSESFEQTLDKEITIVPVDEKYQIEFNGHLMSTDSPVQALIDLLFEDVIYSPTFLPLHGGAVAIDGRVQILLASTGTGKTTLTAYLTQKGYPYLNDDCVLIDMDTLCAVPNCTPLHLRPESLSVLQQYGCHLDCKEMNVEKIHRFLYMPESTVTAPLPIGNIFLLERSEQGNHCEQIPAVEAVQLLMGSMISPSAIDKTRLQCAINLSKKCKRLVFNDMAYVEEYLRGQGEA